MDRLNIRKATLDDLDILLAFEQDLIQTERPFDPTIKSTPTHYYDIKAMILSPAVEVAVAEFDSQVIGSGYARIEEAKPYLQHSKHAYLGFMYVIPNHRGKGI